MIKPVAWASLAFLAGALASPVACAHGAGEPREVDLRVLLDDDGLVEYGGCVEGSCAAAADGIDLLALDVREAWLGDEPALVFRMVYQTDGSPAGRGLSLAAQANGTQQLFEIATEDGTSFSSAGFDRLDGPFDVFDGHPKALDGWVRLSRLGALPGSDLTGITLTSHAQDEPDDAMPGGWYSNGAEVPHVPHEPDPGEALEEHGPGTYTVKGPAPLLTFTATPALLDLGVSGNVTVRVANPLSATAQSVTVAVQGDEAARFASGARNVTLSLDPGAVRDLSLRWPGGAAGGNATLLATSDLGGRAEQAVQVVSAPTASSVTETAGSEGKDTPAPAASLLAPALLALAALAQRRR